MPLIDVTHDGSVGEFVLRRLAQILPDVVAKAVACPEEPWIGPPAPGDIEIRFREKGRLDVGELNCVIEVRTKLFASRIQDKHDRADAIRDGIAAAEPGRWTHRGVADPHRGNLVSDLTRLLLPPGPPSGSWRYAVIRPAFRGWITGMICPRAEELAPRFRSPA